MKGSIGIIGCGNMGTALIDGMLTQHFRTASELLVWDSDTKKRKQAVRAFKVREAESSADLVSKVKTVLVAVKPQQMKDVLLEIKPYLRKSSLLISIAAGIPTRWIEQHLGEGIGVIRAMPNTPAKVEEGATALSAGRNADDFDMRHAQVLFRSVGKDCVVIVPEKDMDAVTAISGSGPAYFFFLMEEMIRAGIDMDLSESVVRQLVLATAKGAAKLAQSTGNNPAALRALVTSKGGTTEAAFKVFERKGLGNILQEGIRAAARRAKELSG